MRTISKKIISVIVTPSEVVTKIGSFMFATRRISWGWYSMVQWYSGRSL